MVDFEECVRSPLFTDEEYDMAIKKCKAANFCMFLSPHNRDLKQFRLHEKLVISGSYSMPLVYVAALNKDQSYRWYVESGHWGGTVKDMYLTPLYGDQTIAVKLALPILPEPLQELALQYLHDDLVRPPTIPPTINA
jgi:hypothetical protein